MGTIRWCLHTAMRTNIVLDDDLMEEALAVTGARTKKEVVHLALEELVRSRKKRTSLIWRGVFDSGMGSTPRRRLGVEDLRIFRLSNASALRPSSGCSSRARK